MPECSECARVVFQNTQFDAMLSSVPLAEWIEDPKLCQVQADLEALCVKPCENISRYLKVCLSLSVSERVIAQPVVQNIENSVLKICLGLGITAVFENSAVFQNSAVGSPE